MKYEWKLTGLKRKNTSDLNNVIVQTYWKKIGTDEHGNVGEFHGATPFDISSVNPDEFTSYEDLTEEMVLNWIKSVVDSNYGNHVDSQIQKQIDEQVNPAIEERENFPWTTTSNQTNETQES